MIRGIEVEFNNVAYFSESDIWNESVAALKQSVAADTRNSGSRTCATPTVCVTRPLDVLEGSVELEAPAEDVIEAESPKLELSWATASAATARRVNDRSIVVSTRE